MSKSLNSDPDIQITKEKLPKRKHRRLHAEVKKSDIAIVGLDYVKEIIDDEREPYYLCELCDTKVRYFQTRQTRQVTALVPLTH